MTSANASASPSGRLTHRQAARLLADRDPVIARLLTDGGLPSFPRSAETPFEALVRAITYQQLAGPAARAIHGRLVVTLGSEVTAERLAALSDEQLRAAGMSASKAASLRDLAGKVIEGTLTLAPRQLSRATNEDVVAQLTTVRGIGRWSAEMFLMFQLRRLDVWPVGDLGVRRGYGLAWQVPTPTPKQLDALGEPFRPYRSVAAWYCWRASELYGRAPVALPV